MGNLHEAQIPGTEITAAAPVGVKFSAGSNTAEEVTPPPPPTPPAPPPTPASPSPPAPPPPPAADAADDTAEEENTTRSSDAHKYFSVQTLLCLTICHFLS